MRPHLFPMLTLLHTLVAFRYALPVCAHLRLVTCRTIIEGRKLGPEVERLKDLPTILILKGTLASIGINSFLVLINLSES